MSSSICIFTHHYHPQLSGIGNFVDGLAHALAARGDRVVIVTNHQGFAGAGNNRRFFWEEEAFHQAMKYMEAELSRDRFRLNDRLLRALNSPFLV